jgi:membrane associated rhomboid family serine protease
MIPIPVGDNIRRQIFWVSTLSLVLLNAGVFVLELSMGRRLNEVVFYFGIIPARYTIPQVVALTPASGLIIPLFASMFLHGGWLHLLGNMLFLFVFGRSIEDRFGHLKFLLIYLLSGLGAAILHIILNAGSRVPTIGASGAIAGILGAYFVSFPRARITTLLPLLFFFWTVRLPALLLLGYWFLIQFFSGFQMQAIESATKGGVAWWAHVGGFAVGLFLAMIVRPRRRQPVVQVLI